MQINAIAGNISTDVQYDEEKSRARFSIANDLYRGRNEDGERKTETCYLPLTAFKHHAKYISEHCKKGDQLIVEYEISNNNYEKDGVKQYGFNFVVTSVKFGKKAQ